MMEQKRLLKSIVIKIDVFISEPDNGIYNAMNKGLEYVEGDYVIFLNAGDYFTDKTVLEQVTPYLGKC